MTSVRLFLTSLVYAMITGVFAQPPGYFPPPSDIDFHQDTLTIYPPDSLPGDPVILLGYNILIDIVFYDNILVIR